MTTAVVDKRLRRNASVISNRNGSIVNSVSLDCGPLDAKSGSFDLGHGKEGSVLIVSVGNGSVNPGFVEGNSDQNASRDGGLPQMDELSDGQPEFNGKSDNISVLMITPFEEPVEGWHFNTQRENSGEPKMENISNEQHEEDNAQKHSEEMTAPDILKKSESSKLGIRDYLMVLALFFITFITYGCTGSLSVMTVEWLKEFQDSKSLILYIPNLATAFMCAVGVIDGILITRCDIYKIILLGCFMQTICHMGSAFATNAITLVIVLGCILGSGTCFSYLNAFILMGIEFGDSGKFFIAALSLAGPFSRLLFSNLTPVFIEKYSWRGCMIMLSAINMQTIPLAVFLLLSHKNKKKKQLKDEARIMKGVSDRGPLSKPKRSFDLSVLKDPLYVVYMCAVVITLSEIMMVYALLPSFLHKKGLTLRETAALYSMYCMFAAIPRILIGLIQRYFQIRYIYLYIALASIFGLLNILINLAESYTALFVTCIFMGLNMGGPGGLYTIGILECLGPEKYSVGVSLTDTTFGISSALFSYLASLLVEYMDSYQQTFCIYGSLTIAFNLCLLITILVLYWRHKKVFSEF